MNALSNGLTIIVESTNKTFHTLDDWGFALGNNNYISDPQMETTYINVPYRDGLIDASEAISGRPIFKKRQLSFSLGGVRERNNWDAVISNLRNNIHGKKCKVILDNDTSYYWYGRAFIEDFDRFRGLGQFTLNMPDADPYKYDVRSSTEPWLWDPFNFETGVITQIGSVTITGTGSITIPRGHMLTTPQIVVSDLLSATFEVTFDSSSYELATGTNVIPSIMVGGDDEVELEFTGSATVQIVYRGGSL